jgi:hypothetical protein
VLSAIKLSRGRQTKLSIGMLRISPTIAELDKLVVLMASLPSLSLLAAAAKRDTALSGTSHTDVKIDLRG